MAMQAFLREEVHSFKPGAADLEYPQCLINLHKGAAGEGAAGADAAGAQAAPGAHADADTSAGAQETPGLGPDASMWYPPLRSTLSCLAKLYRTVDPQAFSGLGQDALYMCTTSVRSAGGLIEKQAGPLDAQLFTIRHLLILREQISSFQTDFKVYDRDLDFTHVRGQLQRLLAGEVPLFQRQASTPSFQTVAKGSLRVQENQVDGKKELEKALKDKCEAFIMAVTKVAVEPMLTFVTKVNAIGQSTKVSCYCWTCPLKLFSSLGVHSGSATLSMTLEVPNSSSPGGLTNHCSAINIHGSLNTLTWCSRAVSGRLLVSCCWLQAVGSSEPCPTYSVAAGWWCPTQVHQQVRLCIARTACKHCQGCQRGSAVQLSACGAKSQFVHLQAQDSQQLDEASRQQHLGGA
jgi:hypothetical protein